MSPNPKNRDTNLTAEFVDFFVENASDIVKNLMRVDAADHFTIFDIFRGTSRSEYIEEEEITSKKLLTFVKNELSDRCTAAGLLPDSVFITNVVWKENGVTKKGSSYPFLFLLGCSKSPEAAVVSSQSSISSSAPCAVRRSRLLKFHKVFNDNESRQRLTKSLVDLADKNEAAFRDLCDWEQN